MNTLAAIAISAAVGSLLVVGASWTTFGNKYMASYPAAIIAETTTEAKLKDSLITFIEFAVLFGAVGAGVFYALKML